MQAIGISLLSAIFFTVGVAAGPLPDDYGFDFQYPNDVINPQPYDPEGYVEDDVFPDYPGLEDYVVVFKDELDLPDEDDEGDFEDGDTHPDNSGGPQGVKKPKASSAAKSRQRRQLLDLTRDTPNSDGSRRPLYRPRFSINGGGSYRDKKNYNFGYDADVGALIYRSRNGRHSLGASVGGSGYHGSYNGYRVNQSPFRNPRVGLGYTYSFG